MPYRDTPFKRTTFPTYDDRLTFLLRACARAMSPCQRQMGAHLLISAWKLLTCELRDKQRTMIGFYMEPFVNVGRPGAVLGR